MTKFRQSSRNTVIACMARGIKSANDIPLLEN